MSSKDLIGYTIIAAAASGAIYMTLNYRRMMSSWTAYLLRHARAGRWLALVLNAGLATLSGWRGIVLILATRSAGVLFAAAAGVCLALIGLSVWAHMAAHHFHVRRVFAVGGVASSLIVLVAGLVAMRPGASPIALEEFSDAVIASIFLTLTADTIRNWRRVGDGKDH